MYATEKMRELLVSIGDAMLLGDHEYSEDTSVLAGRILGADALKAESERRYYKYTPIDNEHARFWTRGFVAASEGATRDANPFSMEESRDEWFSGYDRFPSDCRPHINQDGGT